MQNLQHVNRRGIAYFLQSHARRDGGIAYSFARKPKGQPVDAIPEGYEIFERPADAQVFLRKVQPVAILPLEVQLVQSAVRALAGIEHFIVAAEGDALVIYLPEVDDDEHHRRQFATVMSPHQIRILRQLRIHDATYGRIMRFVLADATSRKFHAQRWCFRGSIDNWITLSESGRLAGLLERYAPHLGKESFFELY